MKRFGILYLLCFFFQPELRASHIIGAEIGYTHQGSYAYEIVLTLYGDCAGSSFPSLPSAIPRIKIYKDNTAWGFIDLNLDGPGVEVTPVCPAEINNTTCVSASGVIPGIMRFIYKGAVTLDGPSANWLFQFNSSLGNNAWAGRSFAITNVVSPSQMALEATLNNMAGPNNSSVFTTIPTPFFCINNPQEFNQGAVDPDADQLTFSLVPGLDADNTGTVTGSVTYNSPYTYQSPLATVPGSFIFNTTNGQMSFTPNLIQTSLVVNKVVEKRAGVIVGSTMREMNIIVLNNCANLSPGASIPTSNVGSFDSLTHTLTICNSNPQLVFQITASDPDNQNVQVTLTGLPAGATASIIGNGGQQPQITITWNLPQPILPGTYTFYLNCEDDGCPLKSKQTIAYTVIVTQPVTFNATSAMESCVPGADGSIMVNALTGSNLTYSLNGGTPQSSSYFTGLTAGTYTITVKDDLGCYSTQSITVTSAPLPTFTISSVPESCVPGQDGMLIVQASSMNGAITGYSINGGTYQNSDTFQNLSAGIYLLNIKDIAGCSSSSQYTLPKAPVPVLTASSLHDITCFGLQNGWIQVSVAPAGLNCIFQLLPTGISNYTGIFKDLTKGVYLLTASTDKGCADTLSFEIHEPLPLQITDLTITPATCDRNNATLLVQTNFSSPLVYTLRPATYINTIGFFSQIAPGTYTVTVRDSNYCTDDTVIAITALPNLFQSSTTKQDLLCNGWGNEGWAEVQVNGGEAPYTYWWSTDPPSSSARIENLYYGWYFVQVTDATGCELKDTVFIEPGPCCENVYLPNAFTPNGDGKNDNWKAVSSTGMLIDHFAIYDRWGKEVWHTRDQREFWDGTIGNRPAETGVYFYLLRYQCIDDGKNYIRKGDLTLMR